MQNDKLQRLIKLVAKTGDKLVVFDQAESDDGFVIFGLPEYEKYADMLQQVKALTEDKLVAKITSDTVVTAKAIDLPRNDEFDYENQSLNKPMVSAETGTKNNSWAIPRERQEKAEEVIKTN